MCFYSKKVKEKALSTSQQQIKEEYFSCEEKLKKYHFTADYKSMNEELKIHKFLRKVMLYQHTKSYSRKMR